MNFGDRRSLILASTFLALSFVTSQAQDASETTVLTFGGNQAAMAQQQAQANALAAAQAQALPNGGGYNPGVGYYNPGGATGGQAYGNVQLCGAPPYVYPCSYGGGGRQSPYGQQYQQQPEANAAQQQQTFGLNDGAPAATFSRQQGNFIDQSPSTTTGGTGNTAGPITAGPPAYSGSYDGGTYTRADIMNPNSSFYSGEARGNNVRQTQIRNAAYQVGIKAGFAAEAQRINNSLLKYRYSMDQKFDFRSLMEASGAIVPPVITTVTDVIERHSATYLYLTTGAYQIVQPAYVTVKEPAWQDYMMLDGGGPTPPSGIKVKDGADKSVWAEAARNGWERGVKEARAQFTAGLDRLVRDYNGMKTYHRLADEGAVSLTKVNITHKGGAIYLNGRKAVGERINVKLTVQPKFKSTKAVSASLEKDRLENKAPRGR